MKAILIVIAGFIATTGAAASPPYAAPIRPVTDDYFGTKIVDDYRWMEDLDNPEVQRWMRAQADHTRATLDALPGYPALLKRIGELDRSQPAQVSSLQNRYVFPRYILV
jgi:prolyl oligopeptidase